MARSIVSGFLSIFGARVAVFAITFLSTPVLVRVLGGPAAYGDYKFLMSGFALLMIVVSSGVTDGVQKFVGESNRYPDWEDHVVGFYVRSALLLALGGGALVAGVAFSGVASRAFGPDYHRYLLALAGLVVAAQFRSLAQRILRGLGEEQYSEPLRVLDAAVWGIGGIVLAWAGLGVTGVLLAHILGGALVAVIGFLLVSQRVRLREVLSRTPSRLPVRKLASFNAMSIVLVLFMTSLYKIDVIMIRTFLTDELTGDYAAALALAEHLWFVPLSIQGIFIHSTSSLWSERRTDEIDDLASKTTRYTVLFTALLALGIAALADRFIPLYYGPGFENAVLPLLILLPGAVALAVVRPIYAIGQGSGELRPLVLVTGIAAAINAVLNFVLIPRFGIVGAAVATTIGYSVMLPLHVASARYIGYDPIGDLRPVRILVTTGVAAVPIIALSRAIEGPLVFLVVPLVGALAFGFVAIATRAVTGDELLGVLGQFPDPVGTTARRFRRSLDGASLAPSLPNVLTVVGILLFVGGITLSLGGAVVPDAGPIGGSGTGPAATTGDQVDEDTPMDEQTQQAGTSTTEATTDDPDSGGGGSGTTDDPDTSTSTTDTTTSTTTGTTDDPTTDDPTTDDPTTDDPTTDDPTTDEPTTTTTTEDPTTTSTTTTEEPTTTTTTEEPTTTTTTTTQEPTTTTTTTTTTTSTTTTTTTSTTTTTEESTTTTEESTTTTTTEESTTTTTTSSTNSMSPGGLFAFVGGWFPDGVFAGAVLQPSVPSGGSVAG